VSVQSALLAVLTTGPAYGSQLQAEVLARAAHRRQLNAGQVYATLDRLVDQGRATPAGTTDDGLPLYALTETGRSAADTWLSSGPDTQRPDWDEMLDQVLVAASMEAAEPLAVISDYAAAWRASIASLRVQSDAGTADDAEREGAALEAAADDAAVLRAEAALVWLEGIRERLTEDRTAYTLHRSSARPRRGRPAAG
jgi:DNA-binding PadR family transcriptional regulator